MVTRIEKGAQGTAIGTVLEAAVLCCVPLFGVERHEVPTLALYLKAKYALLPTRVYSRVHVVDDNF